MTTSGKVSPKKKIRLSSHDVNILSVIAQKKSLPRSYLLSFAQGADISPEAFQVVTSLLLNPASAAAKKAAVKKRGAVKSGGVKKKLVKKKAVLKNASSAAAAASDFSRWAAALK